MHHDCGTRGVCARIISFDLEGDKVHNIRFSGGCSGNLKAISILCEGMSVGEIDTKLRGNECGMRGTSCADQLAIAVTKAYAEEAN